MHKYLPEIFFVIGLALLGYGLFLFIPWVSFTVCGAILTIIGLAGAFLSQSKQHETKESN